jgi:hypothetical protein
VSNARITKVGFASSYPFRNFQRYENAPCAGCDKAEDSARKHNRPVLTAACAGCQQRRDSYPEPATGLRFGFARVTLPPRGATPFAWGGNSREPAQVIPRRSLRATLREAV